MKNKKIIVVIAAVCLLVISVGYALFSSNLNISGTASASGEFDFTVTCTPGFSSEVPETMESMTSLWDDSISKTETGYSDDTCTVNSKDVNMKVNFKYPGAMRLFTVKVTNTGSIPMQLDTDNVDSVASGSNYLTFVLPGVYKNDDNTNLNANDELKLQPKESLYFVFGLLWSNRDTINNGKELSYNVKSTLPFKQLTN